MMWNCGSLGMCSWMWIFPLIFLIVMLLILFRGRGLPMCGGHGTHRGEESARELLDRRYARGEISREEYQQMKKDLE